LKVGSVEVAPVQVAAALLLRLRSLAEARFGGCVRRAIFAVPAVMAPGYGAALTQAARMAGIETVDQVPEPVAGVIGSGNLRPGDRRIAVVDFGGGTFDVSMVEQVGLRYQSRGLAGDPFLGGDDFDLALADAVDGSLVRSRRRSVRSDVVSWQKLVRRSESVKRQLSSQPTCRLKLDLECAGDGDLDLIVERAWLEPRFERLVDRAIDVTQAALDQARWRPTDVEEVVLIGGTTLIPLVQRRLGELFGRKLGAAAEATLAVSAGAAVLAARHADTGVHLEVT
jgi:molecular chaperone DnaK